MKKIKKAATFFAMGSVGYALIELIWRRRTHWTMMLAGGICFLIFSIIARNMKNRTLVTKAALAAALVTAIEFLFGALFNMGFKMQIWDYSDQPFNLLGQICPLFSFFWFLLAIVMLPLADRLERILDLRFS